MSRYILRENFQRPAETSGTVVNISAVKVELSEQAKSAGESGAATGVIHTGAELQKLFQRRN